MKKIFKKELNIIQNESFRKHVEKVIDLCPNYILHIPSSSTGKYHPQDEINKNGMILHIQRCICIAGELARMEQHTTPEKDVLIAGCLLHDVYKNGLSHAISNEGVSLTKTKYTAKTHPIHIFEKILEYLKELSTNEITIPTKEMMQNLAVICLFHEGQWTIDASKTLFEKSKLTMSRTLRKLCQTMHCVDYVASRRIIADVFQYMVKENAK